MPNQKTSAPTTPAPTTSRRVHLYGPNNQALNLQDVKYEPINIPDADSPFAESAWGNNIIEFIREQGPAAAKLFLMTATGSATAFGGWVAANGADGFNWMVAGMIWGVGFILEVCFGYSWAMKGSPTLAGEQVKINDSIHGKTSFLMIGALMCMLLERQAGFHMLFIVWTSAVEPMGAVWLMHQFYKLKGAHPLAKARAEITTLQANMQAEKVRERARDFDHVLRVSKFNRNEAVKRATIENEEANRWLDSKRFRAMIRRETRNHIFGDYRSLTIRSNPVAWVKNLLNGRNN